MDFTGNNDGLKANKARSKRLFTVAPRLLYYFIRLTLKNQYPGF